MALRIVLYDVDGKPGPDGGLMGCWSPNVWKVRLILNYKALDYETAFIEHHEIAPILSTLGIEPHTEGIAYTLPAIRIPDPNWEYAPEYIMGSDAIAQRLEEVYPHQPINIANGLHLELKPFMDSVTINLDPILIPRIWREIIPDGEASEYYRRTREAKLGFPLEGAEERIGGLDAAWDRAQPAILRLWGWVWENKDFIGCRAVLGGPFMLADELSYADIVLVAFMESLRTIGGLDLLAKFTTEDPEAEGPGCVLRHMHSTFLNEFERNL